MRYYVGADLVASILKRYPDLRVQIVGQNSAATIELIRSGESRASDTQNMPVRDECPLEDRVVTLCCPHPERVPGFHDAIAGSIALENRVHDLRVVRIARVDAIGIEPVPNRRQRAEMPVPIKSVTALDSFGS